jgi:hypothetical protein
MAEAVEHQRRWGGTRFTDMASPSGLGQLANLAGMAGRAGLSGAQSAGRGALGVLQNANDLARTAMTQSGGTEPEAATRAVAEFMEKYGFWPGIVGAERGALGAMGGRMVQPSFVDAYHASPHSFDRFDLSRIGTGEGNAARGRGLYFAENPEVSGPGGHYDRQFTAQNLGKYELNNRESGILRALRAGHSDLEIAAALAERGAPFNSAMEEVNLIKRAKSTIYDTRIDAPPHQFVDWDKPFAEQSPFVQSGIQNAFGRSPLFQKGAVGDSIARLPEIEAALRLREAGVPGFKFLDRYSRRGEAPRKTFNYVVTNDKLLKIMNKLGIAGISALPALGAWHFQRDE